MISRILGEGSMTPTPTTPSPQTKILSREEFNNTLNRLVMPNSTSRYDWVTLTNHDTALRAENERLRGALEIYASADNWECPRCHKKDAINCHMGRYCGPCNEEDGHGWDIARAALKGE